MAPGTSAASAFDLQTLLLASGMVVAICGVSFIINTVFGRNDPPGRLWSAAFTAGILTTVAYAIWGSEPSAWWAIAIGNSSIVLAMGCVWSGARLFNSRPSRFPIVVAGSLVAALAAVIEGPEGGDWAGGATMLLGVAVFASLAGLESLSGRMRHNLNARVLAVLMFIVGSYYAARAVVFVLFSPESQLFRDYFGTEVATFVTILFVIVASTSMSILRAERSAVRETRALENGDWNGILPGRLFDTPAVDRIRRATLHGETTAFIGAEIDNLSDMNTAFGRSFGDEAIESFTSILHDHMPTTALLGLRANARFAAIVLVKDLEQAYALIEDVRAALVESPIDAASGLRLSVSWGVTMIKPGETDIAALAAEAHELAQKSRDAGGNRVEGYSVPAQ